MCMLELMKYRIMVVMKWKERLKVLTESDNWLTENRVQKEGIKHGADIFSFIS